MPFSLAALEHPIVVAPLGGGPTTPELAAAVSSAGGLGFLAAGYRTPQAARDDIHALRQLTDGPFGVGVFAPPQDADPAAAERYAQTLRSEADRYGTAPGAPRHDDDAWNDKLALVIDERVPVVSFTFGCPDDTTVDRLHAAGVAVWITVTTPAEATAAAAAGADALVVQGVEAGGHRGSWDDGSPGDIGLLALLQLTRQAAPDVPLVATGGIATGAGIAAVLAAGASAAQLGTAFMRTPEAGTAPVHRQALATDAPTALTRAFTGRTARGLRNRFLDEHESAAPSAYPDVHHVTAPLRAAARKAGDAGGINLWAGQAHALARELPAGELVRTLAAEARTALHDASRALDSRS